MAEDFSARVKKLRLERKMSQQEVGDVIGVKHYSIYSYEKGRTYPDVLHLMALADFFGVTTDYLLGRSDQR